MLTNAKTTLGISLSKRMLGTALAFLGETKDPTRSKTRSRIEHLFRAMVQRVGNVILRTNGIKAADVKLRLRNLAYNMDRYCTLMMQAA